MILSTTKKAGELSFYSRFKIYVLMVSTLAFTFKIIRPIVFSAVRKVSFPQSRKFFTIVESFHNQGIFPQSRKFCTKKDFYNVKIFSANKDQKGSLKVKILDPCNTKSSAKIFLVL